MSGLIDAMVDAGIIDKREARRLARRSTPCDICGMFCWHCVKGKLKRGECGIEVLKADPSRECDPDDY